MTLGAPSTVRLARPTRDLDAAVAFYCEVVGFARLGGFRGHSGYDGEFVGPPGANWHLELTRHHTGAPAPTPTDEDLLVLYLEPSHCEALAARLEAAGHRATSHPNPYWAAAGASAFLDPDGYGLVVFPTG